MNIVIPMAGLGARFAEAGYKKPKPFIDIFGRTMIECVLDNLKIDKARYILIAREENLNSEKATFAHIRKEYDCNVITIDKVTEGAACTILLASRFINNNEPLLLANSDQIVEMRIENFINDSVKRNLDGSILTFYSEHPKWSYAKIDSRGYLIEVKEKEVIGRHATVGLYYYQRGRDFVNSAIQMIASNDRVKNEFYTAPAYNYAVGLGLKIGIYEIKESQMFGLGTPEDFDIYINHVKNKRRTDA